MLLQMFANELSFTPRAVDVPTAQSRVEQFVMTIREAASRGVKRALHAPADFFSIPLADAYYWQNWLRDTRVDRELHRYFLTVTTKSPFPQDDPVTKSACAGMDCLWEKKPALGLKAAYVADGLAISMASGHEWDSDSIVVEIQEIVDDDVSCRNEGVHHASSARHVRSQVGWIEQRQKASIASGRELWERAACLFPSLIFCKEVEKQMDGLPAGSLHGIMRGLFRLNDYCVAWKYGAFEPNGIGCNISPESEQTLEMFEAERTFSCPDGHKRVFSWHAKVGLWRIYFDSAPGPGYLLIGYVGNHLRTVQFR